MAGPHPFARLFVFRTIFFAVCTRQQLSTIRLAVLWAPESGIAQGLDRTERSLSTKTVCVAMVFTPGGCLVRINFHATDGICDRCCHGRASYRLRRVPEDW